MEAAIKALKNTVTEPPQATQEAPPSWAFLLATTVDSNTAAATLVCMKQTPPVDLDALSCETGASVSVLRTLAAVSDPKNKRLFSADAARAAFNPVTRTAIRDAKAGKTTRTTLENL